MNKLEKKRLLILNGSFCELPLIQKAKEMGYYVITTGNMPNLVGHKYSDEYIEADYSDKEKILQIVKENDVYRVVSCANDFGVLTTSYVAEQMGWDGPDSFEVALTLHHKDRFKKFTIDNQIPSPKSVVVTTKDEGIEYVKYAEYPLIVKANDLTGGKGIMKAENVEEAVVAVENAFSKSRDKHVVIEPFIRGKQQTFIVFLVNRKIVTSTSCNCYSQINPYLIQAETFPAEGIEKNQSKLEKIVLQLAEKLQLKDGILALQYIVRDDEIFVIETMRRPFGNQLLTVLGLMTGFPWEEAHIKSQIGESCEGLVITEPKMKYCGHHGIMATKNGTLLGYEIDPLVEKRIFNKIEMIQPGQKINDCMCEKVAYLYYEYDNLDEMNEEVKQYNDKIKVFLENNN